MRLAQTIEPCGYSDFCSRQDERNSLTAGRSFPILADPWEVGELVWLPRAWEHHQPRSRRKFVARVCPAALLERPDAVIRSNLPSLRIRYLVPYPRLIIREVEVRYLGCGLGRE